MFAEKPAQQRKRVAGSCGGALRQHAARGVLNDAGVHVHLFFFRTKKVLKLKQWSGVVVVVAALDVC